jgi:uncharacterized membrane protein (UPF0127 family)
MADFNYIGPGLSSSLKAPPSFSFETPFLAARGQGCGLKAGSAGGEHPMKHRLFSAVILFLFLLFSLGKEGVIYSQQQEEGLFQVTIKGKKIRVEVVRTEGEKARGLMFRDKLGADEGMLFVYEEEEFLTFWMKNTPLPLSIAFIDKKGEIVDIQDMEPFSLRTHTSARPARYALEMNRNWFQKNGIKVGDVAKMPTSLEK